MINKIKIKETKNNQEYNDIDVGGKQGQEKSMPNLAFRFLALQKQKEPGYLDKFTAKIRSKQTVY